MFKSNQTIPAVCIDPKTGLHRRRWTRDKTYVVMHTAACTGACRDFDRYHAEEAYSLRRTP